MVMTGCPLIGGIPKLHRQLKPVLQTLTLFSPVFYDCHLQTNDNQTYIIYVKSTLSEYRKGLCGFCLVSKFTLEKNDME